MGARKFYGKVLIGFMMSFLVMLGDIMANTLDNAVIFNRLGPESYGYFTFLKAFSVVAASTLTATLSGRVRKITLLLGFLASVTSLGLAGALLMPNHLRAALVLLVAAEGALMVGFNFTVWPILNESFPLLTRKKAFPLISAGYGAAGICAGPLVAWTLRSLGTSALPNVFTALVAGVFTLALVLGFATTSAPAAPAADDSTRPEAVAKPPTLLASIRAFPEIFSDAPFLRWLFAFNMLVWVSYRLIDFQFNTELKAISGSEERFGEILGYCYSGINAFIVFYQVCLARATLTQVGLTRLFTFYPMLMVLMSLGRLLTGHAGFAFANSACSELLLCTVVLGPMALVYNVVSKGVQASAQALIEGLGASIGTMISSTVLVVLGMLALGKPWNAIAGNAVTLAATIGVFVSSVQLGRRFIAKALANLDSDNRQVVLNSVQALQERGQRSAIAKLLEVAYNELGRYDSLTSSTAVRTLSQIRHRRMPNLFIRMLSEGAEPRRMLFAFNMLQDFYLEEVRSNFILRQKVLEAVERVTVRSASGEDAMNAVYNRAIRIYFRIAPPETLSAFLEKSLGSDQPRLISNTIEALTYLENPYSYLYIERFLDHPNNRVRSTAIVELWKLREDKEALVRGLRHMLADAEPASRISAIWAIGRIGSAELAPLLLQYLRDTVDSDLRIQAVHALLRMPYVVVFDTLGLSEKRITRLYHTLLHELTDRSDPSRARRALHFAMGMHPSHIRRLDRCVLDLELNSEGMSFLHHNLLEQGADARDLLRFVERFVGLPPQNIRMSPEDGFGYEESAA